MRYIIYLCFLPFSLIAQANYAELYEAGMEARESGDIVKYLDNISQANDLRPLHPAITFRLGTALICNKQMAEGINMLVKSLMLNARQPLEEDTDLTELRQMPAYSDLLSFRDSLLIPIVSGEVFITIPERDLHIEGLAYDPVSGEWYFGSVHKRKIVKRSEIGDLTTFKEFKEDGLMAVMDLEIDSQRRILWVSSVPAREMMDYSDKSETAIFSYDLSTGSFIAKYQPDDTLEHWFGDLALDSDGSVYISDSFTNNIYQIIDDRIELWIEGRNTFGNLQGIDVSDNVVVVSDYLNTLYRIDRSTKRITQIQNTHKELILKGTDGVSIHGSDLIVTMNGLVPNRVLKLTLSENFTKVTDYQVLDWNHPDFGEPTLGVVVGSGFYYIANSSWSAYSKEMDLNPQELPDIKIIKVMIDK